MSDSVEVPEAWREIGYSGEFTMEAELRGPALEKLDEIEASLPKLAPHPGWLALRMNRDVNPVTITMVRKDDAAIIDLMMGPRL